MNGEMYVVHLIRKAAQARNAASRLLGVTNEHRQIEMLREPDLVDSLADKLYCSPDEAFDRFAEKVRAAFAQSGRVPFERAHFELLRDMIVAPVELTDTLECAPDDVVVKLFDPLKMKETLKKVGSPDAASAPLDAPKLLRAILREDNVDRIEQASGMGDRFWGIILQRENWLRPEAVQALKDHAIRKQWSTTDATSALALILAGSTTSETPQGAAGGTTFRWQALVVLRQRLAFLVSHLREQAVKYAEEAMEKDPSSKTLSRLPIWLEIYERGAIRRALPYLIANKKPLSGFVPKHTFLLPEAMDRCSERIQRHTLALLRWSSSRKHFWGFLIRGNLPHLKFIAFPGVTRLPGPS